MMHRLVMLALLAAPALAQEASPVPAEDAEPAPTQDAEPESPWLRSPTNSWTISLEPRVWYAGPAGDLNFPGGSDPNDTVTFDDLNADSPRLSPYGSLRVQRGRLRFAFAGSIFEAEKFSTVPRTQTLGSVAVFQGERASFDFSAWSAEAIALYQVSSYIDALTSDGRDVLRFRTLVGGGLRISGVDLDYAVTPTSPLRVGGESTALAYDGTFAEPVLAAAIELDLNERWMFSVNGSAGFFGSGDLSSGSFTVEPALAWHPQANIGLEVGYRMHIYRLQDGDEPSQFEWSGSIAGLYAGVSIRF